MAQNPEQSLRHNQEFRDTVLWISNQHEAFDDARRNLHVISIPGGNYLVGSTTSETQTSVDGEPARGLLDTLTPLQPGELGIIPLQENASVVLQIDGQPHTGIHIIRGEGDNYIVSGPTRAALDRNETIVTYGSNPDRSIVPADERGIVPGVDTNALAVRRIITAEDQAYILLENLSGKNTVSITGYSEINPENNQIRYVLREGIVAGILAASSEHIGNERETQQDRVRVTNITFPDGHSATFGITADGMGGHNGGEVAAQTCIDDIPRLLQYYINGGLPPSDALAQAVKFAIEQIDDKTLDGGATIACSLLDRTAGKRLDMHVGDARVYEMRNGKLMQIGEDHSWAQHAINEGFLTEEGRRTYQFRNRVSHSVGADQALLAALTVKNPQDPREYSAYRERLAEYLVERDITPDSKTLLCSDGLWEELEATDIEAILADTTPMQAVAILTQAALQNGNNNDNISAVVLQAA